VVRFPNPSTTVPPLKYTLSPRGYEHTQEHHANQKFGWHRICQIRQFMALIYILYIKYMYFSTIFCNKTAIVRRSLSNFFLKLEWHLQVKNNYSIKKSEQPKGNFLFEAGFNIIQCQERIFDTSNLVKSLILSSYLKNIFAFN